MYALLGAILMFGIFGGGFLFVKVGIPMMWESFLIGQEQRAMDSRVAMRQHERRAWMSFGLPSIHAQEYETRGEYLVDAADLEAMGYVLQYAPEVYRDGSICATWVLRQPVLA